MKLSGPNFAWLAAIGLALMTGVLSAASTVPAAVAISPRARASSPRVVQMPRHTRIEATRIQPTTAPATAPTNSAPTAGSAVGGRNAKLMPARLRESGVPMIDTGRTTRVDPLRPSFVAKYQEGLRGGTRVQSTATPTPKAIGQATLNRFVFRREPAATSPRPIPAQPAGSAPAH